MPDASGASSSASGSYVDPVAMAAIMTTMAGEFGAGGARRTGRFDQLAGDSASMWAAQLTSPTISSGLGYRTAIESGSGRTRAETNAPDDTAAQKGA